MSDDLDEVAVRLAQTTLAIRSSSNRLIAAAERRLDLLGTIIGLFGAAISTVAILCRVGGLPDQVETRQLYQRAAGVGRDRGNADIGIVTERLVPLVCAWEGQRGDELVLSAAQRLVAWVADGRPDDDSMLDVEATFARWADVRESKDLSPVVLNELTDRYIEAWATTLQA